MHKQLLKRLRLLLLSTNPALTYPTLMQHLRKGKRRVLPDLILDKDIAFKLGMMIPFGGTLADPGIAVYLKKKVPMAANHSLIDSHSLY